MSTRFLSSLGTVTKKERLVTAEQIHSSILIFETEHPYSGYYGTTVPDSPDSSSFFLVTKHQHNDDHIIRAIQGVKKSFPYKFDGVPGHISFRNKLYGIIRIRCVSEIQIPELIEAFIKEDIMFMLKQKHSPVEALIHITKYFNTEEVEEGIFIDLKNDSFAYLSIDKHLRWSRFENITKHVKNNVEGISFDAALSTLYDDSGIIDLVRVYDDKRSVEKLKIIRSRYLDSIK